MRKGSHIEVCSEEEGFKGVWFRATLLETKTKAGRKKLPVRYMSLLNDDGSPLIETIAPKLIRPVQPLKMQDSVVLGEGTVVDANNADGLWTGVIIKKDSEGGKFLVYFDSPPDIMEFERSQLRAHLKWIGGGKWVVPETKVLDKSMYCPGTLVEVSDKAGVAWIPAMIVKKIKKDAKIKFIIKADVDCNKRVSANCVGGAGKTNSTVDWDRVRPVPPPPSSVEEYEVLEFVEVFHGSGWRVGLVREILLEKRYKVILEASKKEVVLIHEHLRPLKMWKNDSWRNMPKSNKKPIRACSSSGSKRATKDAAVTIGGLEKKADDMMTDETLPDITTIAKDSVSSVTPSPVITTTTTVKQTEAKTLGKTSAPTRTVEPGEPTGLGNDSTTSDKRPVKGTLSTGVNKKPIRSCSGSDSKRATNPLGGLEKKADDVTNDETLPDITPTAKDAISPVTPSPVITTATMRQTAARSPTKTVAPDEPIRNLNCLGNDSTIQDKLPEEQLTEDKSKKRKRDEEEEEEYNGSNDETDDCVIDEAVSTWIGNFSESMDVVNKILVDLPFVKKSPYWKKCEITESFKSAPQRPHFSPLLLKVKGEEEREWSAVGMMTTFYGLLEEVKDIKLEDSVTKLNDLSASLGKLEEYGFEVAGAQTRIGEVLSLKDTKGKKEGKRKEFEERIGEEENGKRELEKERVQLKEQMLMLERQDVVVKQSLEVAEKNIVEMKSNVDLIQQEIGDVELECLRIVSAPW